MTFIRGKFYTKFKKAHTVFAGETNGKLIKITKELDSRKPLKLCAKSE
jgi:hypothetical protein